MDFRSPSMYTTSCCLVHASICAWCVYVCVCACSVNGRSAGLIRGECKEALHTPCRSAHVYLVYGVCVRRHISIYLIQSWAYSMHRNAHVTYFFPLFLSLWCFVFLAQSFFSLTHTQSHKLQVSQGPADSNRALKLSVSQLFSFYTEPQWQLHHYCYRRLCVARLEDVLTCVLVGLVVRVCSHYHADVHLLRPTKWKVSDQLPKIYNRALSCKAFISAQIWVCVMERGTERERQLIGDWQERNVRERGRALQWRWGGKDHNKNRKARDTKCRRE